MNRTFCLLGRLFAFVVLLALGSPVFAAPPSPSGPYTADPQHIRPLSLFTFVQTPPAISPAPPAIVTPPAVIAPSATASEEPDTSEDLLNPEPQENFGTKSLNDLIAALDVVSKQGQAFISDFVALPEASAWLQRQNSAPRYQAYWAAIGNDLVSVVGVSFLAALLIELILFPVRRVLRRRKPEKFYGRVAAGFALLGLRFLTVFFFVSLSLTLLDRQADPHLVRFVVLNVVYAIAIIRLATMSSRLLFAPRTAALRLIPSSAAQATYVHHWICAYSVIIPLGYFCVDVAYAIHFPEPAIAAFRNILNFILVAMTIVVIIQKRTFVSVRLRANLPSGYRNLSLWQSLRLWLARRWHILAMAYLIIGYVISAFGVQNGFTIMLRGTIITLFILVLMRALFHAVNRWGATDASDGLHHAVLRFLFRIVIWMAALTAAAAGWGVDIPGLFATPFGQRVMGACFSVGVTIVSVTLVYEIFSALIDRHLNKRDTSGEAIPASARARTLLPMIRNTAFIIFTMIVGLVVLSAAGVNIAPLLAGAGVLGVAIGFGSQTLVRDFMTGLFIVLENVIAVGDYAKIGEFSGIVETISVRTIRLRDENGALHVLPFSEVTKISNMTRDFSFAFMDIGVAYDSDLEHVMDVIRSVGKEVEKDKTFGQLVMEPVEVLGVENLGDFSITIRSRLRTRPGMQREVRRMFLLRLKQRFDKEGIVIPFPTVNHIGYKLK